MKVSLSVLRHCLRLIGLTGGVYPRRRPPLGVEQLLPLNLLSTLVLEAENGTGDGTIVQDNSASGGQAVVLQSNQSRFLSFPVDTTSSTVASVRYSNPNTNGAQTITVRIDGSTLGNFQPQPTFTTGLGFTLFLSSDNLGPQTLAPGNHVITVIVIGGNGLGIEIDSVTVTTTPVPPTSPPPPPNAPPPPSQPGMAGVIPGATGGPALVVLDSNGNGIFDNSDAAFPFGLTTDTFLTGHWAGAGPDNIGVARPTASGVAQLTLDTNGDHVFDAGDSVFNFGLNGDVFLAGDWNGDGKTKIGVVRPGANGVPVISLDTNGDGVFDAGDTVTSFGLNGDTFLVGDWNGAGKDEIGIVRPTASGVATIVLDTNGNGVFDSGDTVMSFGLNTDTFLVGDWNGDGRSKIGVVRPGANGVPVISLDTNGDGVFDAGDTVTSFGLNGDGFVIGDWNGDGRSKIGVIRADAALLAADGALDGTAATLTVDANFWANVDLAAGAWAQVGVDPQSIAYLRSLNYRVASLPGAMLGYSSGDSIVIDDDAAGHGWSTGPQPQPGEMDLFTVLAHEMGHVLGVEHSTQPSDIMFETLQPGIRKSPSAADDVFFA